MGGACWSADRFGLGSHGVMAGGHRASGADARAEVRRPGIVNPSVLSASRKCRWITAYGRRRRLAVRSQRVAGADPRVDATPGGGGGCRRRRDLRVSRSSTRGLLAVFVGGE